MVHITIVNTVKQTILDDDGTSEAGMSEAGFVRNIIARMIYWFPVDLGTNTGVISCKPVDADYLHTCLWGK